MPTPATPTEPDPTVAKLKRTVMRPSIASMRRVEALSQAVNLYAERGVPLERVIETAKRFEAYIKDGT